nr:lasso peptide biosynthesis B2 protein [Paenibacillus bovis]
MIKNFLSKLLIIVITIPLLITFKYFKKWTLIQKVDNLCNRIQMFTKKFSFLQNKFGNGINAKKIRESIILAIVLCPVETVCTERALAASIIFTLFGFNVKMAYGVRFRPYLMHIWIESEDQSVIFDSPREKVTFIRMGVIK